MKRLFLDNNISSKLVLKSKEFYNFESNKPFGVEQGPLFIEHVSDRFKPDDDDSFFVKKLQEEGNWMVISADLGKHTKKKEKLPDVCKEFGVTCVQLTPAIAKGTTLAQAHCLHAIILNRSHISTFPDGTIIRAGINHTPSGFYNYQFNIRN
jgi:hypothetical protein